MRPHFTVVLQSGVRLDANHIAITRKDGRAALAFVCSGELQVYDASEVSTVTYAADGASWCGECNQPLTPHGVVVGPRPEEH